MSPPPETFSVDAAGRPAAAVHRFAHLAMASVFEILVVGQEARYARQAAEAAFDELDRLQRELSRFDPSSDVSQINALRAGERGRVGVAAMECLALAARVHADTRGAFDVTVGPLVACCRNPDGSYRRPSDEELQAVRARTGMHLLDLAPEEHMVGVRADGVIVDLGGVGKGYAVDHMMGLLREWSISAALVHGGMSSVLASGSPPGREGWRVALRDPQDPRQSLGEAVLKDRALSGSAVLGGRSQIIDPRAARPASGKLGAWAAAGSAALSDCLSTAFYVMTPDEVRDYCAAHPDVAGMLALQDSDGRKVVRFGEW